MLKSLKSGKEKGQCAAAPAIPGFIIIISFPKTKRGKNSPITPRIQRAQPGVKSKASVMAMADRWHGAGAGAAAGAGTGTGEGRRAPAPTSAHTALLISPGAGTN